MQFSGRGKYFFANGDRYEGEFDNGERDGFGTIFYASGGRRSGEWSLDKLVGEVIFCLLEEILPLDFFFLKIFILLRLLWLLLAYFNLL